MKTIRAIIAEDEGHLRRNLRKKLATLWPELEVCGEAQDGVSTLDMIDQLAPDVAFLDINMPLLSGIEVARKVGERCLVVFITAYDEYAVEAFESEAVDYLLKPLTDKRLKRTIERLKRRLSSPASYLPDMSAILEKMKPVLRMEPDWLQWIKAPCRDGVRLISVQEIYYFKSIDNYTAVKTRTEEFLIRKTIRELAGELDPAQFWRIHRAAIVNVGRISKVGRSLTGRFVISLSELEEQLIVSRTYSHLFKAM